MPEPLLAAAVVVGECRRRSQRVIDALGAQSAALSLEVLVVDIAGENVPALRYPAAARVTYLRVPGLLWSAARALAVREAGAPVIAFIEDHCFPAPHWAEKLIEAHAGDWAAVG